MSRVRKGACGARKNTNSRAGRTLVGLICHSPAGPTPNLGRALHFADIFRRNGKKRLFLVGRGGWPSRILVHFRAFEPKPRCRGTRAAFGLYAVLATCPVFAFGARNPLFLGLKLMVGISVALQFGHFFSPLLHADGGDARSRGAQFRSGSLIGCIWRLMSARGGSRGSCCRVLACFPD